MTPCQILRTMGGLAKSNKHLRSLHLTNDVAEHDQPLQKTIATDATNISVKIRSKRILGEI
jgi:hypothetical protein